MIQSFLKYSVVVIASGALALVALGVPFEPQPDWKISGPFGGTATTITVGLQSPKTLLAGALSTLLYRSDDFGRTWSRLNFPPRHLGEITATLMDPADPTHYFAGVLDPF